MGIFDLPAKVVVLNAKQYNGRYGCSVCVHPRLLLPNNARIYLPLKYVERTHHDVMRNAETAEREGKAKKASWGFHHCHLFWT